MKLKISILYILLLSALAQAQQSPRPDAVLRSKIDEIDDLARAEFQKQSIGSITIGVVSGSTLVWTKSYGYADMEKKVPATAETVYRIGSITKMFTAAMLLQLMESGKVRLSDPVEKYFPDIDKVQDRFANAPPVTLLQLATHTSGLAGEPDDLTRFTTGAVSEWERVLLAALPRTRYMSEPGVRYLYSNIGYAILGAALSKAAGEPYEEYLPRHLFTPLRMSHTSLSVTIEISPKLARGYAIDGDKIDSVTPERENQGRGYKVPVGAIYSTVGDLARFLMLEMGDTSSGVLKAQTIDETFGRGALMNANLSHGYGIGYEVFRNGDVVMFGHGGSVAGYQSGLLFNRQTKVGLILLRNASGGNFNIGDVCIRAFAILAGPSPPPGPQK